jgi:hypothetical protein
MNFCDLKARIPERPVWPVESRAADSRCQFALDTQNGADTSFQVPRDPPHPSFGRQSSLDAASSDRSDCFDTLAHIDLKTNTRSTYRLPRGDAVSEPIFVPRDADARECDGFLLATIYRGAEHRSDLAVFDATAVEKGPLVIAELSHRVPFGFHGNWRAAA